LEFRDALSQIRPLIPHGTIFGPSLIKRLLGISYQNAINCAEHGVKNSTLNLVDELSYEFIGELPSLSDLRVAHKAIFDNLNEQYESSTYTSKKVFVCCEMVTEKLYYLDVIRKQSSKLFAVELLPFVSGITITERE
jgi:hypothetical protein